MKGFQNVEVDLLRQVMRLSDRQLLQVMGDVLREKYTNVIQSIEYVVAEGDIPIALVAHTDTVFPLPPRKVYYDREENVMWAQGGAGFDDRAGVFMILQILQHTKLRPHIILTTGEEKGGIGAYALTERFTGKHPFKELKYIIQLDRQGANDCVFYDCINRDFINYVSSFGFVERIGSFSDISFLCPIWEVCGVNLSVGYYDEHSPNEILCVSDYFNTFQKVKKMLMAQNIPNFEWRERQVQYISNYKPLEEDSYGFTTGFDVICKDCRNVFSNYETVPVKMLDGSTSFYCVDCLAKAPVNWCEECGEAFEALHEDDVYCYDCIKDVKHE